MKPPTPTTRGIALVLVLAFLVLISGLLLAFFSTVSTERSFSANAANAATTQQLANSAVNIVMAQITDGTRGHDANNAGSANDTLAWASQPGMIRNYDVQGAPKSFYKLYSSDQMIVNGAGFQTATDLPPDDWSSAANAGLYTDLNAPVLVPDPSGTITANASPYSAVYPIVDPYAEAQGPNTGVNGFSLSARPGFINGATLPDNKFDPTQAVANKTANPAPMPVKWLYLLRDGKVAAPMPGTNGAVNIQGASISNPVIGRMAFWTDDDCSKVNLNTASEGTYWDTPRITSSEDYGKLSTTGATVLAPGLAITQPAQKEFQRYAGHPATTSLSPILGNFGLPISTGSSAADFDPYYAIAPRIVGGGSRAGTARATGALVPDADRLYASVDELMFTPALGSTGTRTRNVGNTNQSPITKEVLEKTGFFLTAGSNAPEVTLFNTPRLSIWPVWADAAKRTTYDQLAAFCGTFGGNNYFFTRANARSGTADYTGRNVDLYRYLQTLTSREVPGYGGNFLAKYGSDPAHNDRDQILTLIYDYVRCINLADTSQSRNGAAAVPYTPPFTATSVLANAPNLFPLGSGEVVPIQIGSTRGAGRICTVSEADLLFYTTQRPKSPQADPTGQGKLRAVLVLGFSSPMQGLSGMKSSLKYTVAGLEKFTVDVNGNGDKSLNLPAGGTNFIEISDIQTQHGRSVGGTEGLMQAFWKLDGSTNNAKKLTTSGGNVSGNYPFFSATDVQYTNPAFGTSPPPMKFKGGDIVISLYTQDTGELVQTINLNFPNGNFPLPNLFFGADGATADFNTRIAGAREIKYFFNGGDVMQGVQIAGANGTLTGSALDPTAGDTRMIAPLAVVPKDRFSPEKKYGDTTKQWAHGLDLSVGLADPANSDQPVPGTEQGVLINAAYPKGRGHPILPSRVSTGVQRSDGGPGEWDTGIGNQPDGSYLNKPDEGDARFENPDHSSRVPYYFGGENSFSPPGNTFFSPNRQVPSALMFGSLPTGVQRRKPWQTLLFNPRPEDPGHPGNAAPADHLLADLFWMPVVEPYAISQPLATSGKINLNYQIVPFTYINRKTGMYAALKPVKFLAIPTSDVGGYKQDVKANGDFPVADRRRVVDPAATLQACDARFGNNDIYKSATEICTLNLVPVRATGDPSGSDMATFWRANGLTGDNLREKPYADLYPRLTTKSNTFTVHVCVQLLKKTPATPGGVFVDPNGNASGPKDAVLGEYRGSTTIERYVDPNDATLPDFASAAAAAPSIDHFYRFRVTGTKRFAP